MSGFPSIPAALPRELINYFNDIQAAFNSIQASQSTPEQIAAAVETALSITIPDVVQQTVAGSVDSSTPPKLSGLQAAGSVSAVILTYDAIPYGNSDHTRVYRSITDDPNSAEYIGSSTSLIYADQLPGDNNYYYWIRSVSKAGKEGPFNQSAGTQASADFWPTHTVAADRIVTATLAALSANLGTVIAGLLQSPDQTFTIDLNNKEILITGPNGQASDDYMIIRNGKIESYKYINGTHQPANALTHIESGVAVNGTTVQIPGYFSSQPNIMVSPKEIQVYDATYDTQDQTLKCVPSNITEYATGQWEFDAVGSLILAAGSGSTEVNWTNGSVSTTPINSTIQTTEANVTEITANIRLKSIRGTGVAPNYNNRKAEWKIYYRAQGDTTWLLGSSKTTVLGDTIDWVAASDVVTGLTAGIYEFYIEAAYYDDTGTFQSGSGGYLYDTFDTQTDGEGYKTAYEIIDGSNGTTTLEATLEAYSPPSGWEVYSVNYSYKYGYYCETCHGYDSFSYGSAEVSVVDDLHRLSGQNMLNNTCDNIGSSGANNLASRSFSSSSYDQSAISGYVKTSSYNYYGIRVVEGRITEAKAVISIRTPITNSATPDNDLNLVNYQFETGSSTELSEGTLNWMAIGR